jgi:type IV secretion system protein VirB9
MRNKNSITWAVLAALVACSPCVALAEDTPVAVDSRIRTLVYSANEVFKMYTEYGYQSNIEFAPDEQITTISIGSPAAFKITPSGSRLFIKALQKGRHTNMTVLTTKRSYQFELFSDVESDDRVIYVMRFYYPKGNADEGLEEGVDGEAVMGTQAIESGAAVPEGGKGALPEQKPAASQNTPSAPEAAAPPAVAESVAPNYNYSLTGPEALSPVQVYDNGKATYFKFTGNTLPAIYGVSPDGMEFPLPVVREGEYAVVNTTMQRFSVRDGSEVVCVYNESFSGASLAQPVISGNQAR